MVIGQGDVFWIELDAPEGSEPGYSHPHVIIQNNMFNESNLNTVVVCVLTSNLKRAAVPGNVLLEPGEGGLPKQSVVVVSQIFTVDKQQLEEYIGTLSGRRVRQILDGLRLLTEPRSAPLSKKSESCDAWQPLSFLFLLSPSSLRRPGLNQKADTHEAHRH
ncbi:MAG: type II toxin-antitoxin system PemK/MazF family toxin [Caldilineales bacterium]